MTHFTGIIFDYLLDSDRHKNIWSTEKHSHQEKDNFY